MRARLITIPFSHYCEKARWALDRAKIDYAEEGHLPVLHVPFVRRAGGRRQVPILVTASAVIEDSTRIIEWADALMPEDRRLFPREAPLRAEVSRWETRFDEELGPHVRRWGYGQLLPMGRSIVPMLGGNVPSWERTLFGVGFPLAAVAMRRSMRITPAGVERSLAKVNGVFAEVSAALSDGRRFLVGDAFSAADMAFAALACPAVFPREYERWLCGADALPASARTVVEGLRATPAGAFAQRVYEEHREA